jgi:taurine dioxygenase
MQVTPTSEHVGALVSDIDITELTDGDVAALDQAWAAHGVLFFRDQTLTEDEHIEFAERFSTIDINKFFTPVGSHPQIAQVLKEADQELNVGGGWHTDHSYDQVPARGSILVARDLPNAGGETRFLSVGAAYDSLSAGLQATLDGLQAHHSNEHVFGKNAGYEDDDDRFHNPEATGGAVHPVVITHPMTGRRLLYVNFAFTTHFVGWTPEESQPLLNYLYEHVANGPFSYEFEWEPGSIAMWDNRSTWHWALNNYAGHRRLMHRITLAGDELSGVNAA